MLIMNKCDLVDHETVAAWTAYFKAQYPALKVVTFTSFQATTSKKKHRQAMKVVPGVNQLVSVWRELGLPGADVWAATAEARQRQTSFGLDHHSYSFIFHGFLNASRHTRAV